MPDSSTSEAESDFVCECEEWMRSACAGEAFYEEREGKRYCVLHFPGLEKSADFSVALRRKLENNDFKFWGVWFPDPVSFGGVHFSAAAAFHSATFSAIADFGGAQFPAPAIFTNAVFQDK